jgi:hypothetical protein
LVGPKTTVVLSRETPTADGRGGFTSAWADLCTITGVFAIASGSDRIATYARVEVDSSHVFMFDQHIPYIVTEKDRLRLDRRFYLVNYVLNPSNTSRFWVLFLREVE